MKLLGPVTRQKFLGEALKQKQGKITGEDNKCKIS